MHLPDKLHKGLKSGHLHTPAIAISQHPDEGPSYQHHHLQETCSGQQADSLQLCQTDYLASGECGSRGQVDDINEDLRSFFFLVW